MTPQQHTCVMNAIKCIQEARKWLDQAMYYTDPHLPAEEQRKVRASYDLLCSSIDAL